VRQPLSHPYLKTTQNHTSGAQSPQESITATCSAAHSPPTELHISLAHHQIRQQIVQTSLSAWLRSNKVAPQIPFRLSHCSHDQLEFRITYNLPSKLLITWLLASTNHTLPNKHLLQLLFTAVKHDDRRNESDASREARVSLFSHLQASLSLISH
jgi:hypothetical protein